MSTKTNSSRWVPGRDDAGIGFNFEPPTYVRGDRAAVVAAGHVIGRGKIINAVKKAISSDSAVQRLARIRANVRTAQGKVAAARRAVKLLNQQRERVIADATVPKGDQLDNLAVIDQRIEAGNGKLDALLSHRRQAEQARQPVAQLADSITTARDELAALWRERRSIESGDVAPDLGGQLQQLDEQIDVATKAVIDAEAAAATVTALADEAAKGLAGLIRKHANQVYVQTSREIAASRTELVASLGDFAGHIMDQIGACQAAVEGMTGDPVSEITSAVMDEVSQQVAA